MSVARQLRSHNMKLKLAPYLSLSLPAVGRLRLVAHSALRGSNKSEGREHDLALRGRLFVPRLTEKRSEERQ